MLSQDCQIVTDKQQTRRSISLPFCPPQAPLAKPSLDSSTLHLHPPLPSRGGEVSGASQNFANCEGVSKGGSPKGGAQHFAIFPFPAVNFVLSSFSWSPLVELWPRFKAEVYQKCALGVF